MEVMLTTYLGASHKIFDNGLQSYHRNKYRSPPQWKRFTAFCWKTCPKGRKTTHDNHSESNGPSTNREEVELVAWLVEVHGQHSDWLYFLETWLVFHLRIFLLRPRPSLINALHLPSDLFEINQKALIENWWWGVARRGVISYQWGSEIWIFWPVFTNRRRW